MSKIDFTKLNSANVTADNSVDTEKVYDINANVNISGNSVNSIDGGSVKKDDVQVATFSMYGGNVNTTYNNLTKEEKCAVIYAVDDFIEAVKTKVQTETIEI